MKKKDKTTSVLPVESVINKILVIRNQKVILDRDLAVLYGVETRALKQAVRRNIKRFPEDFLLILTRKEIDHMVSQNVIPSKSYFGGANPMAFTEQGVAMLSSVLNSERAIEINILIMRAFVKLREIISTHKKVKEKLKELVPQGWSLCKNCHSEERSDEESYFLLRKGILRFAQNDLFVLFTQSRCLWQKQI